MEADGPINDPGTLPLLWQPATEPAPLRAEDFAAEELAEVTRVHAQYFDDARESFASVYDDIAAATTRPAINLVAFDLSRANTQLQTDHQVEGHLPGGEDFVDQVLVLQGQVAEMVEATEIRREQIEAVHRYAHGRGVTARQLADVLRALGYGREEEEGGYVPPHRRRCWSDEEERLAEEEAEDHEEVMGYVFDRLMGD